MRSNTLLTKTAICLGIFLHDPVSFTAVLHPEYFTFKKGVVRVETQGICTGHTLMDQGLKKYAFFSE
jgi:uridine nucleosidase